ncbi:MAG: sensor histidine kinase, partial [Rhodoferax sp.]|nr:sensor histidine kinase [Rhodoferax sp.]
MFEQINHLALIGDLMQQMCVYLVVAYLLSKTPLFAPLMQVTVRLPDKLVCYVVFSGFCIMGTYLGFNIEGAIANTRAIGAVLGGLLGGPVVGLAVGLTGGMHRYSLGGFSATACAVSTVTEGLIGGALHMVLLHRHQAERLLKPSIAFGTTLVAECAQMLIILALAKPSEQAARLVAQITLPMVLTNSLGAALFMRLILDRRETAEKYSIAFSAKALRIAERSVGVLMQGFNAPNCSRLASIIQEETGVGAVAITDCDKLLGFVGVGADHHLSGTPISSPHTLRAIADNAVVYADGVSVPYR